MNQSPSSRQSEKNTGLRRGDKLPSGGRFVGVTRGGVTWVAFERDNFHAMCELFDRSYAPRRLANVA